MENQNDGLVTVESKTIEAGNFSIPKMEIAERIYMIEDWHDSKDLAKKLAIEIENNQYFFSDGSAISFTEIGKEIL